MSIGGLDVLAAGVSFPGSDGVGVVGIGAKQPVMPTTKLNSKRTIRIRFIAVFLHQIASNFSTKVYLKAKAGLMPIQNQRFKRLEFFFLSL